VSAYHRTVRARKRYRCDIHRDSCTRLIEPGEEYLRVTYFPDDFHDRPWGARCCMACAGPDDSEEETW
jgi:hypothetical protein